jgi:hypothetical protein
LSRADELVIARIDAVDPSLLRLHVDVHGAQDCEDHESVLAS